MTTTDTQATSTRLARLTGTLAGIVTVLREDGEQWMADLLARVARELLEVELSLRREG